MLAIIFGLSSDYEVFLVSRIKEEYTRTGDAAAAVERGTGLSARVVTAAALIMFAVFAAFMMGGSATIKAIGFSLAAGVLFDAFVVRLTLVPAVMSLAGGRIWYHPNWFARRVPDLDIEGATLEPRTPVPDLTGTAPATDYSLGHSDAELRRLMWQAEVLRPYTERLLRMAGIGPGMRVLDVGCGTGDMTMLAARLVGPSGSVTGIDRGQRPLATAARRAESARMPWVRFHHAALLPVGDRRASGVIAPFPPRPVRPLVADAHPGADHVVQRRVMLPRPFGEGLTDKPRAPRPPRRRGPRGDQRRLSAPAAGIGQRRRAEQVADAPCDEKAGRRDDLVAVQDRKGLPAGPADAPGPHLHLMLDREPEYPQCQLRPFPRPRREHGLNAQAVVQAGGFAAGHGHGA
jgi:SAM-dependent methyltransferase